MAFIIFNHQCIDENKAVIHTNDRGLTLGHGLFETLFANKGQIPLFTAHFNRLQKSAKQLDIILPLTESELKTFCHQLLNQNEHHKTQAGLRITITAGQANRGITAKSFTNAQFFIKSFPLTSNTQSLTACIVNIKRNEHSPCAQLKSISYLENVLAKKEAEDNGFDEAILLNSQNHVVEGAISNLFIVEGGRHIITPPTSDGVLPGIVRQFLLESTLKTYNIIESTITKERLLAASEVFITNSLLGVMPLNQVNDVKFKTPFSVSHTIAHYFKKHAHYE